MKVANSYPTLLRGVSQQVPQERAEGQHTAQVNMLADPVNGLTRRHGSLWQAHSLFATTPEGAADIAQDALNWRHLDWDTSGKEYVVLHRTKPRVGASGLPAVVVYNKTDKSFLNIVTNPADTAAINLLHANGLAAITSVGKYLFATANGSVITGTSTNQWDTPANLDRTVVWVRGGAFSRTYSVTATKTDNSRVTFSYTTPTSSYQGVLTTSDIAASDPEYTKKVNDRVNAYNGAVTAWIGTSTAAVQPAAIAEQLRLQAVAAGLTAARLGSHVYFTGVKALVTDDAGDGTLLRGVADEIASVDQVSVIHHVGKVVKVRSRNAQEAYYLKAVAKDKTVTTGYTEVTWVEGAGVEHAITGGLYYATVQGSNLLLASSAAMLDGIDGSETPPTFSVSQAGDNDSAPRPFFIGRQVTYLGTFQNRLLVGSGGVLAVSKTEDYLNFFRSTVLSLPASDPFEMLPTGSEDDSLLASTLYDQDLVVFGKLRQYVISGKVALTPTSANMAVMSSYEDAVACPPVAAGGFIFYAKSGTSYSSLYQIQPGQTDDSPESFPASSQVDSYLSGTGIELSVATGSPSLLFMRTTGSPHSLYTFAYLDKQDGRKMDAWSRWDFNPVLGSLLGVATVTDGVLVFTFRPGVAGQYWITADLCPTVTALSAKPYLDSQRPWEAHSGWFAGVPTSGYAVAFDNTGDVPYTGAALADLAGLQAAHPGEPGLQVGALQDAYFEPTNPYYRDANGKAIITGRLTVTKFLVAFRASSGFVWELAYRGEFGDPVVFNGRILGDPANVIGREPVTSGQHSIAVGREVNQFSLRLRARSWYPFTVTALEWVGQFFNRVFRGA